MFLDFNSLCSFQVSPACENGKNEHVICVYNPNYQDVAQVMRVENLIRSAGITNDLLYKPDIFSALGIYRNNQWGFRATIYTSRVLLAEGRSKISIAGSEKFYHNSSKGFESPQDFIYSHSFLRPQRLSVSPSPGTYQLSARSSRWRRPWSPWWTG